MLLHLGNGTTGIIYSEHTVCVRHKKTLQTTQVSLDHSRDCPSFAARESEQS